MSLLYIAMHLLFFGSGRGSPLNYFCVDSSVLANSQKVIEQLLDTVEGPYVIIAR